MDYKCSQCGAEGVKLWRQYNTFVEYIKLMCADCAAKDQKEDISTMTPDGRYTNKSGIKSDQIRYLVPAVPSDDGSFWGYTSVPQKDVNWWRNLPIRKEK